MDDSMRYQLESIEQQLMLLQDIAQNQDIVQTTGSALAFTFENLIKQIREVKKKANQK